MQLNARTRWNAGHTVALVEGITGMVGVDELLLTLREAEPVRVSRAQVLPRERCHLAALVATHVVFPAAPPSSCSLQLNLHARHLACSLHTSSW